MKSTENQAIKRKEEIKNQIINDYYKLFINAYKINGLDDEQSQYIMRQAWKYGTWATFKPLLIDDELMSSCYVEQSWNAYDFPINVRLINKRNVIFIPNKLMVVNDDVVLGYANKSHDGVLRLVEYYAEKIANVEMCIENNLTLNELPFLITCSPTDRARMQSIMNKILNHSNTIYLDLDDVDSIKALNTNVSFNVDKLYAYKQALENELLTKLGIDNIGMEKKERLIVDEANSNNQIINDYSDSFLNSFELYAKQIKDVFGFDLNIETTSSPAQAVEESMEDKSDESI